MDGHSWMLYISIVVLLAFSAFFSASETSLSSLNKIRLRKRAQDGDLAAKTAIRLTERYGKTLNTILVGNTILNIILSTVTALVFTALLPVYGALVSTIVTTVLVLCCTEILPKSYASAHADRLALLIARPLHFLDKLLTPVTFLFGKLQRAFARRVAPREKYPTMTEEELHYIIGAIEQEGVLEEEESNLVQSALDFDETSLREIITPRVDIEGLDADASQEEIRQALTDIRFSRLPVYEGSVDNIIGVLFVHDAVSRLLRGEPVNLRALCEEPYFVHKGMKLSSLMRAFQSRRTRMAVVLDEYGGTLGLVTLLDMMEELVGDLANDADEEETLRELGEGRWEVTGGYAPDDLFETLGITPDTQDSDYSTVSGWAMSRLGHIPNAGEGFEDAGYAFTVAEMEQQRIGRLLVEKTERRV